MTTPNVEFIRELVAVIEANPERFDMKHFAKKTRCGTVHCVAGWAAAVKLGPPTFESMDGLMWWSEKGYDPNDIAAEAMGLDPYDADDLFYDFSIITVDDLKSHLTTLTGVTFP